MDNKAIIKGENGFSVFYVNDAESLRQYSEPWDQLALEAPQKLPFLSYTWIHSFIKHRLQSHEEFGCLFAFHNDSMIGVLPIISAPSPRFGKMLTNLYMPFDWHTISVDFLFKKGYEEKIFREFITALDKVYPGWIQLQLNRIPENSPTLSILNKGFKCCNSVLKNAGLGSYLNTEKGYEEFLSGLSKSFKKTLQEKERRLEKNYRVNFVPLSSGDMDDNEILRQFIVLEAAGKKGRGGAIALNKSLVEFYKELVRNISQRGWLCWYLLQAGGHNVAMQMGVRFGEAVLLFKTCYDEDYAKFSPGTILRHRVLKSIYGDPNIALADFLTDLPMHSHLHTEKLRYYDVVLFPKRFLSELIVRGPRKMIKTNRFIRYLWNRLLNKCEGQTPYSLELNPDEYLNQDVKS